MATESIFHNIAIDSKKAEAFITTLEQDAKTADNFPLHHVESENVWEDSCRAVLSTFMCPFNPDVEDFIHNKAMEFARKRIAITFIVFKETESSSAFVGYYMLANKFVSISCTHLSKTLHKKIAKFSQYAEVLERFMVSMPSFVQNGRNFNPNLPFGITGANLLSMALQRVLDVE